MEMFRQSLSALLPYLFNLFVLYTVLKSRKRTTGVSIFVIWGAAAMLGEILALILDQTRFVMIFPFCYITFFCVLTILICKWMFSCNVWECIFLYFVIQSYVDDCLMVAKAIQTYGMKSVSDWLSFLICYSILLLTGAWLFVRFACKKLQTLVMTTQQMMFWKYIWIMPVSFYFVYRTGISPQYISIELRWEKADVLVPLLWAAATIISYLMVVNSLLVVAKQTEDRERLEAAGQLLHMQKQQYRLLEKQMESTKRIRHDWRHQILALQGHVDADDMEGVKTYLKQNIEWLDTSENQCYCDNYAVNAIIQYYLGLAEQAGVQLAVKAELSKHTHCSDSEISIILGNLLENALEACRRQTNTNRYIKLNISVHGGKMTAIQIENSCGGPVKKKGELFLSAKRNFSTVGVGILSVEKLVEKYYGNIQFEYTHKYFRVSALF